MSIYRIVCGLQFVVFTEDSLRQCIIKEETAFVKCPSTYAVNLFGQLKLSLSHCQGFLEREYRSSHSLLGLLFFASYGCEWNKQIFSQQSSIGRFMKQSRANKNYRHDRVC